MSGIIAQNTLSGSGLVKSPEAGGGNWVLIKTLTSDGSDATMSFVNGSSDVVLDSTYPIYFFQFINIHVESNGGLFTIGPSLDTGSNYNVATSAVMVESMLRENHTSPSVRAEDGRDSHQATSNVYLHGAGIHADADECMSGHLYLFNPASTVMVKHFISEVNYTSDSAPVYNVKANVHGYINTTSAIDAIQFKLASDEIQGGKIKLYGIKDS